MVYRLYALYINIGFIFIFVEKINNTCCYMQDFLAKTESSALRIAIVVVFGTKFQDIESFSLVLKFLVNLTNMGI